jgi:hypothetical protein
LNADSVGPALFKSGKSILSGKVPVVEKGEIHTTKHDSLSIATVKIPAPGV